MNGGVVVIGIGNPFRGDDGVGPAVLDLLAGRVPPHVRLVPSDGEPSRLLDQWHGAATVVVVDAAVGAGPPGTVRTAVLRPGGGPDRRATGGSASCHGLGLADALGLAVALGRAPETVVVHAVEAASTAHGARLSPAVRRAAADVAARVLAGLAAGTKPSAAGDVRP